jgi:predicted RecA/RadA family phage recombinase
LLNNTANGEVQAGCTSVGGYIGTNSNHPFSIRSNSVEKISVLANGYVGINETNPDRQLKVNLDTLVNSVGTVLNAHPISEFLNRTSDTIERGLEIGAPSSNVTAPVYLKVTGTTSRFAILNSSNNEDLTIADSRVGINITNPASNLHVRDESSAETTAVRIRNFFNNGVDNSKVGLRLETATADNQGGTGIIQGVCGTDAGGTNAQNDGGLRFLVSSGGGGALSEAATFTKFGNLAFPNGQGIDFSASTGAGASSNLLDDYEEGTFTPAIGTLSSNIFTPYTNQPTAYGNYVKIGELVYVTVYLTSATSGAASTTDTLGIGDLPFATANDNNSGYAAVTAWPYTFWDTTNLNNGSQLIPRTQIGRNFCYLQKLNASASSGVVAGDIVAGINFMMTATYISI